MKRREAFRFRIHPDSTQHLLLRRTVGCCRLVYNLALEQRRMFGRKGRSITYLSAANELKELKIEAPYLEEVPHHCLQQALRDLNTAFVNFFQGRAAYPKPRSKHENDACRFPDPEQFKILRNTIKLPKLGEDAAHQISRKIANAATHVAFENLDIQAMTASTAGTIENPGKNVAQKSGLNRNFLDVAPGMIRRMTGYKLAWAGGVCVNVSAAYTSQVCSHCQRHPLDDVATKHIPHGRINRDQFVCPFCGFSCHADINAAINIRELGRLQWTATVHPGGPPGSACRGLRNKRAYEAGKKIEAAPCLAHA